MKYIISESKLRKAQFMYLDYLFDGIYEVELRVLRSSRFWEKDNKLVLELRPSNDLLVSLTIWSDIQNMFSLSNHETYKLIKEWAEQRLELEAVNPIYYIF